MHQFPECVDLLDEAGTHPPVAVQLLGVPAGDIGSLPDFGGRLHWITGEPGAQAGADPVFVFMDWDEALAEALTSQHTSPDYRSIVVILHAPDDAPPTSLNGRPLVHVSYDGEPRDAVLGLVAPLLMPLIYRSVVCVAIEDYEFLFAQGGRLRRIAEARHEDLNVCLAEMACQLGGKNKPAGGYGRLLTSMLLPSPLPAFSVVDRVLEVVQRNNAHAEPSWLISTLVHQEITTSLCMYAIEPADKL